MAVKYRQSRKLRGNRSHPLSVVLLQDLQIRWVDKVADEEVLSRVELETVSMKPNLQEEWSKNCWIRTKDC